MATRKPISTISYNTEEFLKEVLDGWIDSHLIQCYTYIKHKGEDGDKDHIHLRIEPNKSLDPMNLTEELKEYVEGNSKPLGVRPWRPSKEEDWFLYAIHDKNYLAIKYSDSRDGKLEYKVEDIVCSDGYDVEVAVLRARQSLENTSACIIKQIKEGRRVQDLIEEGKDVFRTKAVLQTLRMTDYETLCNQYRELAHEYDMIILAIKDYGLEILPDPVDDNRLVLKECL